MSVAVTFFTAYKVTEFLALVQMAMPSMLDFLLSTFWSTQTLSSFSIFSSTGSRLIQVVFVFTFPDAHTHTHTLTNLVLVVLHTANGALVHVETAANLVSTKAIFEHVKNF